MFDGKEYVYAVYEEKSFSKAAQKLFVSQSAVSAMVRKAEAKIGCQIFDRSTIPLTVTKEGEYYIKCAEQRYGGFEHGTSFGRQFFFFLCLPSGGTFETV